MVRKPKGRIGELARRARSKGWVMALREAAAFIPMPRPTTWIGSGSSLQMCERITQLGYRKILLVSDRDLTRLGLYEPLRTRLLERGASVVVYDRILPDPTVDQVEAGLTIYKQNHCDAVVAVGGGSVLDAAKMISIRSTNDKALLDMQGFFRVRHMGAPLFVVPTTHGTGSEATIAAVVSDTATHRKTGIMDLKLVPTMAALDPDLAMGLPRGTTIFTSLDTMTHALESLLSVSSTTETEHLSYCAIRMVEENLPKVLADPSDKAARLELLLAAYYAGLAFTQSNLGYVHAVAHRLGGYYQIPHGKANAIVLPYVLELMVERNTARMAVLARQLGKAEANGSEAQAAQALTDAVRTLVRDLGIPDKVEQLLRENIPTIAAEALEEAHEVIHYAVPFYLDQRECEALVSRLLP